jgi:hypothetical protein
MGRVKIPYYVVIKGRGYWQPTARMRAAGFGLVACGADGPAAWGLAAAWAERWRLHRTGQAGPPGPRLDGAPRLAPGESAVVYPPGSVGDAFARLRRMAEWTRKAPRTREDWWRGWKYIGPIFGDLAPAEVTLAAVSDWRQAIEERAGLREAHRALKIWRALWKVAAAEKLCDREADPSLAVRNAAAGGRGAVWSEGEVVRLAKGAWRAGYHGLAVAIAVAWDTQLSPVDVRSLRHGHVRRGRDGRLAVETARAKTGEAVAARLCARTDRLVAAWLARTGGEPHPAAPLVLARPVPTGPRGGRPRAARPYTKDSLGDEFRAVRLLVFGPAETRQLADLRRSGAVEAIEGGAGAELVGQAMGNSLGASNALFRTYVPVTAVALDQVGQARRKGRAARRKSSDSAPFPPPSAQKKV